MTNAEIIQFVASIASLILAIVAISLSIVFYKLSKQLSEETKKAANQIVASVNTLKILFNKLYGDTFSIVKDTFSHMWKYMRPEETAEEEEKIEGVKKDMAEEINSIIHQQKLTDEKMAALSEEMNQLVSRAIDKSRQVEIESREETLRLRIINAIQSLKEVTEDQITLSNILTFVRMFGGRRDSYPYSKIVSEVKKMKSEGLVYFDGDSLDSTTPIEILMG